MTLEDLAVRPRDAIAGQQPAAGGGRIRIDSLNRDGGGFEPRREPERRDPQQIARDEEREIRDVRGGRQGKADADRAGSAFDHPRQGRAALVVCHTPALPPAW